MGSEDSNVMAHSVQNLRALKQLYLRGSSLSIASSLLVSSSSAGGKLQVSFPIHLCMQSSIYELKADMGGGKFDRI